MGHSSKKKKRGGGGGGGRRSKASRADHNSLRSDDNELLAEEITALCAIFQDDCRVVSESPPQVNINLRPYSKDMGYEELDISALLSVRYLPGYPYKCPKLQISPEKGLSTSECDKLLALLHDQANSNAREGRVMIYNLVEAAQEFLSEIAPLGQLHDSAAGKNSITSVDEPPIYFEKACLMRGPFVYGFLDLFSGSGESWQFSLAMEDSRHMDSTLDGHRHGYGTPEKTIGHDVMPSFEVTKQGNLRNLSGKTALRTSTANLEMLDEKSEEESSSDTFSDQAEESDGNATSSEDALVDEHLAEIDYDQESTEQSLYIASPIQDQSSQTNARDLILAHLLRVACAPKGPLADSLPEITSELYNLGVVSHQVRDYALKSAPLFDRTFNHVFAHHMASSKNTHFWMASSDIGEQNSSATPSSRYLNDFEELQPLGQGGFGHVVLCKNKLDGRQYAMKKIRLKDKSPPVNDRIVREVATLSRLQHQHVVRYYQAWFETGVFGHNDGLWGSESARSSSFSYIDANPTDLTENDKIESTYLYIQMEYCPRTLRQMFESYDHFDKERAWNFSRQIVEGLAHIHGQGIIHRDLTPNNIFFDARSDIKIGDFGLAKFLKLEQLEQDLDLAETPGVSVDGTGRVGTYFYTAPEIEQGWLKINEKADMYSFGIVFLELWHPFTTAMERHIVLSDLKQKGELPSDWVAEFPEQAMLLRRLMSPSPSDRPSATELLKHVFPPRMEYELVDNILRKMHSSEDTSIRDKVVNALFDEEIVAPKARQETFDTPKLREHDASIQYTELDTAVRDQVVEVTVEVFKQHCAKHMEILPMQLLGSSSQLERKTVKLLANGGDMIELCQELRLPFVNWVVANQKTAYKRYEVCCVYRRAIGHSPPNRYLQGDLDIVGGAPALTEAEVIKAAMSIIMNCFHPESCDIHLNHGYLLDALWSWIGIKDDCRHKVAELLSMLGSLRPQSPERKLKWGLIRQQLRQELNLTEAAVNKLHTVVLRFCGDADQALPRLRGALPSDKATRKALDELAELMSYLRVWKLDKHVHVDPLMPPTESYHRNLFFQIFLRKDNNSGSLVEGTLLAVGGRYDHLIHSLWTKIYVRHLDLKRTKEVDRENVVKFLSDAFASQFRNPSMWT
ncbi:hypothetical protein DCAR_0727454 [Daucus carota subsp. sativus]|uniref:non-specific serine/threonine protein kinase n=1 Tax=Daucus carota subsp. sativus TaxID=79200 RepID=A0AAF1B7Z6_DAUCS|nr:hypothetical protein DCAR_0727454 [Daucus carota subsp. sativus]